MLDMLHILARKWNIEIECYNGKWIQYVTIMKIGEPLLIHYLKIHACHIIPQIRNEYVPYLRNRLNNNMIHIMYFDPINDLSIGIYATLLHDILAINDKIILTLVTRVRICYILSQCIVDVPINETLSDLEYKVRITLSDTIRRLYDTYDINIDKVKQLFKHCYKLYKIVKKEALKEV